MPDSPSPPAFTSAPPRRVLMLCIHNSARSQIAEGFARAMAPPGSAIWSAGTQPTRVHPLAIEVMNEVGVDISGQRSKPLDQVPWHEADTVITLCEEAVEDCPRLDANTRRVHWPLPDPASAPKSRQIEVFREVRDEIRWRVSALWPSGD